MKEKQERIRAYVLALVKENKTSASELARKAGFTPTTLTRFLNEDVHYCLKESTLAKIAEAAGKPGSHYAVLSENPTLYDLELVFDATKMLEEHLKEKKKALSPERKRELIRRLCEHIVGALKKTSAKDVRSSDFKKFIKQQLS